MFGNLSILEVFMASPTMLVLFVCSIVTLGYTVERGLYFARHVGRASDFMKKLAPKVKSGSLDAAKSFAQNGKGPVARVITQALAHLHLNREDLTRRVGTAIELEQVEMERNLSVLGTMSNIAPLLGLFGTVIGIIRAFADIARTGSGGSSVVAMGVSEALMTTAAGIIVAVIATVFFNVFVRMIRTRSVELEDAREEFFSLLLQREQSMQNNVMPPRVEQPRTQVTHSQQVAQQTPAPAEFLR